MKNLIMRLFGRTPPGGMGCRDVGRSLQQFLDAELDDAERVSGIEAHLEACRRCRMEAETYERIKSTIAATRPDLPVDSLDRLRSFGEQLAAATGRPVADSGRSRRQDVGRCVACRRHLVGAAAQ